MLEIPRITGQGKATRRIRSTKGKLVHGQLAKQNRAGGGKTGRGGGILAGDTLGHDAGARRGLDAFGIVQILQSNGNAVQRPFVVTAPHLCLGDSCRRHSRLGQHRNVGVQRAIEAIDAL